MKFNKLALGVSLSVMLMSGVAVASGPAPTTDIGDNAVHFPKNDSTISTNTTDIWFASATNADDAADGYLIHIVNHGTDTGCVSTSVVGENRYFVSAGEITCDNDSVTTAGVAGDYSAGAAGNLPALKLCKWTTPDELADGNYALGVSPISFGVPLNSNAMDDTDACKDDKALKAVDIGSAKMLGNMENDDSITDTSHYNAFKVDTGAGSAEITQAPSKMVIITPAWNNSINFDADAATAATLVFKDYSPAVGKANWYEILIQNSSKGNRIELEGDNPNAKNWFKVDVDPLLTVGSAGTDAGGAYKTVTITDIDAVLDDAADGIDPTDVLTIWVRGYNDEKSVGPWSDVVRANAGGSTAD